MRGRGGNATPKYYHVQARASDRLEGVAPILGVPAVTSSGNRSPVRGTVPKHGAFALKSWRRAIFVLSGFLSFTPPMLRADDDCIMRCAMFGNDEITLQANENCVRNCRASTSGGTQGPRYDPCYIAQNALRPCTAEQRQAPNLVGVDHNLVGTWELSVRNAEGVARWVWEIHANGTYDFHAEGPGAAPSHRGTFAAAKGNYTLKSTTSAWDDSGTYQVTGSDTLVATGRLGTGSWHRVRPSTATDSARPASTATDSGARPANPSASSKR